ncbi:MAG: hypothetical protein HOJ35_08055 [Bdellovibrionales bacterium]|nr:hypothetical protein [Bdellovibrionales bacterium]
MEKLSSILVLLLMITACKSEYGPQESLRNYVNYRFSSDQTKEETLSLLTGQLYSEIKKMDDQEFDQFSRVNEINKKKFKILANNCEEKKCFITYIVKYEKFDNKDKSFLVDTKKVAELLYVDNEWKISDVSNIKTFYNSLEEIAP